MPIVTEITTTATEQQKLETDKVEILIIFVKIQKAVNSLAFSKLKKNLLSANFTLRHRDRLTSLESEIKNYANDDYLVSVLGRFSSGKSSLINAILGVDILPTKVDETTSVITKISYEKKNAVWIHYRDGRCIPIDFDKDTLYKYLCNQGKNYSETILEVVVQVPSDNLKNGITIIDTPGLGSAFSLNNQTANDVLLRSSAIIMTLHECSGQENEDIIKKIFQWNYENYYTIIFVITKKDIFDDNDENDFIKSVLGMIDRVKTNLQHPDIKMPYICAISSKYEMLFKQYITGQITIDDLLKAKKLPISSVNDVHVLHTESGFEDLVRILNKTILKSNIRISQIINLLLNVNAIVGGIYNDLNDYLHYIEHYETIEDLETALNEKIDFVREIEDDGNNVVSELQKYIEEQSHLYKTDKLDDLVDKIYCEMVDYIDSTSFEKLKSNKFKKLIQQLEDIRLREIEKYSDGFNKEIETQRERMLEHLEDIIKRATKKSLSQADSISVETFFDNEDIRIHSINIGKMLFISLTTIPAAAAGGFVFGNMIFPGIGGIVGASVFGSIGLIANVIGHNDNQSEKRKASVKESIQSFLKSQRPQNRQIITSIAYGHVKYCIRLKKQLANILKDEKQKRDDLLKNYESEKENVKENVVAIRNDLMTLAPFIKEIGLLLAKYRALQDKTL